MSTTTDAGTLHGPLCLGSQGKDVLQLQELLLSSGLDMPLQLDGKFGKKTHTIVLALQRREKLVRDGVVGPRTAKALGAAYKSTRNRPYVIRLEAPPLPAMTPPLQVIGDVILAEISAFQDRYINDIAKSGLPLSKQGKVLELMNEGYRVLKSGLENQLSASSQYSEESEKYSFTSQFLQVGVSKAFADWQLKLLEGVGFAKKNGGKLFRCAKLVGAVNADSIAGIITRVFKGEESVDRAIMNIRFSLRMALQANMI